MPENINPIMYVYNGDSGISPSKAYKTDVGFDLTALSVKKVKGDYIYETNAQLILPTGYGASLRPRSSIRNYGIVLSNAVGVIDSGYRGSIQATFNYYGSTKQRYAVGDRIGQLVILPYPQVEFEEVEELSETIRGNGGFGSSGL